MKNKEISFFVLLCLSFILFLSINTFCSAQSDYITTDATVEPTHFSTIDVDGGRLRISREFRNNISSTDDYDGMSLAQPHTALRYIPNNNVRYNVTGHTATGLSCRSIKNNAGNILYISGTARTNALSNGLTEWQRFINALSSNTQPNVNVGSCFCTDTQSRYQLQTGAFCGHNYCLNEDCVIDTHAGYPANFDTANPACLANSGYHIFGCTNELCNYEESYLSLQQVPGKNTLIASGTATTLGDATQIHTNRSNGFCEICGTFTLPQTGSKAKITPINRSFFGSNPILNLYKISNVNKVNYCRKRSSSSHTITCSLDIQDKLLKVGTQAKSISWNKSGKTVTVTVCFRYKPSQPYNAANDCTKNGTCSY